MIDEITKRIVAFPPLPKTLIELQEFQKKDDQNIGDLLTILEKDPLIMVTLLKIANSAMFSFRNKVETTRKAVELLGINFTLSIAFGSAIKTNFNNNLECYSINSDEFLELSSMRMNLLYKWLIRENPKVLNELFLSSFLQDIGQFVISDLANSLKLKDKFLRDIRIHTSEIPKYEEKYFGASASKISAMIFKRWNLDENLVHYISNIDKVWQNTNDEFMHSQILYIVGILTNSIDPLGTDPIKKALMYAEKFNLNYKALEKAIEIMNDRLLDA